MRAILLLYIFVFSFFLSEAHSFQSVSLERGMLQSHVLCMHKDKKGYLWFGTFNGLHRFDGNNFLYFLANDEDSTSISNRGVHAIFENEDSTMWVGTKKGLNLYDPKTNKFTVFDGFPCNEIRSIDKTDDGLLWLGTYGGGVCSFDVNSNEVKNYTFCQGLGSPVKYVNKVLVSRDNEVWVGTEGTGLLKLDPFSNSFSQIKLDTDTLITIMSIKENAYGELWLATWGNGAFKFNPVNATVTNYTKNNTTAFSSDVIRDVEIDSRGRVWLATQQGLVNLEGGLMEWELHQHDYLNELSLSFDDLWSLYLDEGDNLWIGTFGNGLSLLKKGAENLNKITSRNSGLKGEYVNKIFQDKKGRVWIATSKGGVQVFNYQNQEVLIGNEVKHLLKDSKIFSIHEDSKGDFWLGSSNNLFLVSKDLKNIQTIKPYSTVGKRYKVFDITEDSLGNIWVGGWKTGLLKVTRKNGVVSSKIYKNLGYSGLMNSNLRISDFHVDHLNQLWIAMGEKIYCMNVLTDEFVDLPEGLKGRYFYFDQGEKKIWIGGDRETLWAYSYATKTVESTFLKDYELGSTWMDFKKHGNDFWVVTEKGLIKLSLENNDLRFLGNNKGIFSNVFIYNTMTTLQTGETLIGTTRGVVSFNEKKIVNIETLPDVAFLDFKISGESISIEKSKSGKKLSTTLNYQKEVSLDYDENYVGISFSSLDPISSAGTHYSYMLEGVDHIWHKVKGVSPEIIYNHLSPGDYLFKVKSTNSIGTKEGRVLKLAIHVTPPFWGTWLFRGVVIVAFILIVLGIIAVKTKRSRNRNKRLKNQILKSTKDLQSMNQSLTKQNTAMIDQSHRILMQKKKLESNNKQMEEVMAIQNMLFSIIGHDLNSPLQSQKILFDYLSDADTTEERQEIIGMLKRSQDNLINLTSDLLNWAIVHDNKQLELQDVNLVELLKFNVSNLKVRAQTKEINLKLSVGLDAVCSFEKRIVEMVLRNVLTNAIKFAPAKSTVYIHSSQLSSSEMRIDVIDAGNGFTEKQIARVFNDETLRTNKREGEGFGVGLNICVKLLKKINGQLLINSQFGNQNKVSIVFPFENLRVEKSPSKSLRQKNLN